MTGVLLVAFWLWVIWELAGWIINLGVAERLGAPPSASAPSRRHQGFRCDGRG
jgi:hypothetical protein